MMTTLLSDKQQAHAALIAQDRTKASKGQPLINASALPPAQKKQVWLGINKHAPELADMLTHDPNIHLLKNTFGASLMMTAEEIEKYSK